MRSCCSTPRTAVAGARSATSAQAPCRSTRRSSASATIHISWNCARPTVEPLQRIDAKQECRSLETTDCFMTQEEKIEAIRQKCIEANPEIKARHYGVIVEGVPFISEYIQQPIRLADVLNAMFIGEFDREAALKAEQEKVHQVAVMWELRVDHLTQQSSECI